jgi:hypothetical protein
MLKVHDDKYMICEGVHMDGFSVDEHTTFDQFIEKVCALTMNSVKISIFA